MKIAFFKSALTQRSLSLIGFCLFSAWNLSFIFEGQVLYSLVEKAGLEGTALIISSVFAVFAGLFSAGFFIKSQAVAKKIMLAATVVCITGSLLFYRPSFSPLWFPAIVAMAYSSGLIVAGWGYYFKMYSRPEQRFVTAADVLIYANILMLAINALATKTSALIGLTAAVVALAGALFFFFKLEARADEKPLVKRSSAGSPATLNKPFIFLCIFILVITINSGLMYYVVKPSFAHYGLLTTYYWAIPYLLAVLVLRNLPAKINKVYFLFVAIVMIGLSYISFMWLEHSVLSYLLVNTLMLGAFGVCDLFWWSILGSFLDYYDNAARIWGLGLSMNVLGVLAGGIIGMAVVSAEGYSFTTSVIALLVIFAVLILLPLLNVQLTRHLKEHAFLIRFAEAVGSKQDKALLGFKKKKQLTEKEIEVVKLLLQGYTYKVIAEKLFISENTLKYHVKNIYQKLHVNSKMELMKIFADNQQL